MDVEIAISTPTAKIRVPMMFTCGGRPTRVEPHTHSGNVWMTVPAANCVMTKSSMDSANASNAPESTAGKIDGKVTSQKVVHGPAPRSRAASSVYRSNVNTRARTTTATNEIENITWATRIVAKPRPRLRLTKYDSSEA